MITSSNTHIHDHTYVEKAKKSTNDRLHIKSTTTGGDLYIARLGFRSLDWMVGVVAGSSTLHVWGEGE